jgi:hypothetical protein
MTISASLESQPVAAALMMVSSAWTAWTLLRPDQNRVTPTCADLSIARINH